jgi:large subunit ribosomal protein L24
LVSEGAVKDPGKNRMRLFTSPNHRRQKVLAAVLSPNLKGEYGIRSLPIRRGDTVVVRRGDRTLQEGKVSRVDPKRSRVFVENIKRERADGREVLIPLRPESLTITKLELDDKWRKKILERRGYEGNI